MKFFILDISIFLMALFVIFGTDSSSFLILIILVYETLDTICYYVYNVTLSVQFIGFIDVRYGFQRVPAIFYASIACAIVVVLYSFLPRRFRRLQSIWMVVRFPVIYIANMLLLFFGFRFTKKVCDGFVTVSTATFFDTYLSKRISRINSYFDDPIVASLKDPEHPRNLVLILGESLEAQLLGTYNQLGLNDSMPYTCDLAKRTMIASNIHQMPFTSWSVAGLFASQCGLPLIVGKIEDRNDGALMVSNRTTFKCVGDYLKAVGYKCNYLYTGPSVFGGMMHLLTRHGFTRWWDGWSGLRRDSDTVNKAKWVIRNLAADYHKKKEPFMLMIGLEDTHPPYSLRDCVPRKNYTNKRGKIMKGWKGMAVFDCLDQNIEILMNAMHENGLNKTNTEIIIHGDHTLAIDWNRLAVGESMDRKLFAVFASQDKGEVTKNMTHYDIAASMLDILGVEYSPKFPFSLSVMDPHSSSPPTDDDISYLAKKFDVSFV